MKLFKVKEDFREEYISFSGKQLPYLNYKQMKSIIKISTLFILILIVSGCNSTSKNKKEESGLLLGVQAYTFHKFSFQEAIDKTNELGLKYIEAYYGQPLGEKIGEGKFDYKMDATMQQKILDYAKSKHVKIMASGVIACNNNDEWKQLFDFAKAMGIEVITCEPEYNQLKYVDKLANEYNIKIAIHNHPKPSLYWKPDLFLSHVKGLSKQIGACVDIGHFKRMGIDPVEALKKYEGRINSLHFKDIQAKEEGKEEQRDIIWGQGVIDIDGVIAELKRQNFNGLLSIEYEYNWENSVPDIKECINYFNTETDKIY
jgi:sugar phosphate isomerase/epimerase